MMNNELREVVALEIHMATTQIPGKTPHECDYEAADAAIAKMASKSTTGLWTIRQQLRKLVEELESEIPGYSVNEYEAGCSSGRQRAITAIESILEG